MHKSCFSICTQYIFVDCWIGFDEFIKCTLVQTAAYVYNKHNKLDKTNLWYFIIVLICVEVLCNNSNHFQSLFAYLLKASHLQHAYLYILKIKCRLQLCVFTTTTTTIHQKSFLHRPIFRLCFNKWCCLPISRARRMQYCSMFHIIYMQLYLYIYVNTWILMYMCGKMCTTTAMSIIYTNLATR